MGRLSIYNFCSTVITSLLLIVAAQGEYWYQVTKEGATRAIYVDVDSIQEVKRGVYEYNIQIDGKNYLMQSASAGLVKSRLKTGTSPWSEWQVTPNGSFITLMHDRVHSLYLIKQQAGAKN